MIQIGFKVPQEKLTPDFNLVAIFIVQMQTTNHILAKEGILTAFAIAKRVTSLDIKQLRDKIKSENPKSELFQELLNKKIFNEIHDAFENQKIPGLLMEKIKDENEEKKRIVELTYFASLMAKKLTDNKVSKYHSCYVVNAIVNMLGLTEENFDEFHRKFARFRDGIPEDPDSE